MDDQHAKNTFVEEMREHLQLIENELLALEEKPTEASTFDALFRAAHSIKGSSNMFGLKKLAQVAHQLESWMDRARHMPQLLEAHSARTILEIIDELVARLDAYETGDNYDLTQALELVASLPATSAPNSAPVGQSPSCEKTNHYSIELKFAPDALVVGIEPLAILLALNSLGDCQVVANTEKLPALADTDLLTTYIDFQVEIKTTASSEKIRDLLDWGDAIETLQIVPSTATEPAPKLETTAKGSRKQDRSIRVDTEKVDELMALLSELVITHSHLEDFARQVPEAAADAFTELTSGLARDIRNLQDAVLRVRMIPMSSLIGRLPRLVSDVSHKVGKQVRLNVSGERTEIDKRVLEALVDPMQHLVRNSIDHGLESSERRVEAGKDPVGIVSIHTRQRNGFVEVTVGDDGAGINCDAVLNKAKRLGLVADEEFPPRQQILNLLFAPGLSTADTVTDVSGRGVGMDVVRQNIESLGGSVSVESIDKRGTTFTVRLPLTLAIVEGQLVRCANSVFVIPLLSVEEVTPLDAARLRSLPNGVQLLRYRDQDVPLVALADTLLESKAASSLPSRVLVVVQSEHGPLALAVEEVLDQRQVVVKSMASNYGPVSGVSAATVLGNGSVAMIIDVNSLMNIFSATVNKLAA